MQSAYTIALLLSSETAALHLGSTGAAHHVRHHATSSLRMSAPIEPGEPGYKRQQVSGMLGGLVGGAKDAIQRAVAEVVVKKEAKSFYKQVAEKTRAELEVQASALAEAYVQAEAEAAVTQVTMEASDAATAAAAEQFVKAEAEVHRCPAPRGAQRYGHLPRRRAALAVTRSAPYPASTHHLTVPLLRSDAPSLPLAIRPSTTWRPPRLTRRPRWS